MINLDEYKTFHDLIHKLDKDAILAECRVVDAKNVDSYADLIDHLRTLSPVSSGMTIIVNYIAEDDWYDVGGIQDNEHYAIEFNPWSEWLGMAFTTKNCDISLARIAAECLNEMSWMGWEEDRIQEFKQGLIDQVKEIGSWTDEERKERLIEWKPKE